jgi:hypothetical protein
MVSLDEGSLAILPADVQISILTFLACGDLVHITTVSREWHGVTVMDLLLAPTLTRHFTDTLKY